MLRGITEALDHAGRHVVDRHVGGDGRATGCEGLKDQRRIEPRQSRPAMLLGNGDAAHAESRTFAHDINGKMMRAVPLDGMRRQAVGCENLQPCPAAHAVPHSERTCGRLVSSSWE